MSNVGLLEELAYKIDQVQRYLDYLQTERWRAMAGGGSTGPLVWPGSEQPEEPKLSDAERGKCPLCQAQIGLNRNSPFLAYNDSPRTRHLMDVHKRTLDEAQELIKKYLGR